MRPSNLKLARITRGMTLRHVAEILNVTNQAVSNWELGKRTPHNRIVKRLASIYGVSVRDLSVDDANRRR